MPRINRKYLPEYWYRFTAGYSNNINENITVYIEGLTPYSIEYVTSFVINDNDKSNYFDFPGGFGGIIYMYINKNATNELFYFEGYKYLIE